MIPLTNLRQDIVEMAKAKLRDARRIETLTQSSKFRDFLSRLDTVRTDMAIKYVTESDYLRLDALMSIVLVDHHYQDTATLRSRCRDRGIAYYANMTREGMIEALEREDA
jgi:hypothetical protein